ncbi:MAG: hypothetical protein ACRESO_00290, partial [Gammaproteobacteria bacterium]
MKQAMTPPSVDQLGKMGINLGPGSWEGITYPLYDTQPYPAAGVGQIAFFTQRAGQNAQGYAATNLDAAGSVPSPNVYVATGLELDFISGAVQEVFGVGATLNYAADINAFYRGLVSAAGVRTNGFLQLNLGAKVYVVEPLEKFVPSSRIQLNAASSNATTAAAAQFFATEFASLVGIPYEFSP